MVQTFLVMAGGAIGAGLRFHLGRAVQTLAPAAAPWPVGTLAVNMAGCLLMGVLAGALDRGHGSDYMRLFAGVGILGGFTTFSAFGLDAMTLVQEGRLLAAGAYVIVSVAGSLLAVALGFGLAHAATAGWRG